jgi:hypothetical protein
MNASAFFAPRMAALLIFDTFISEAFPLFVTSDGLFVQCNVSSDAEGRRGRRSVGLFYSLILSGPSQPHIFHLY